MDTAIKTTMTFIVTVTATTIAATNIAILIPLIEVFGACNQ